MKKSMIRTYSELSKLSTFEERYEYLKLSGVVGEETFGFDRHLNQMLYKNPKWKAIRDEIIIRDCGCDLGIDGYELKGKILVHHMNPISVKDITSESDFLYNPEYLIATSLSTHNAIHYGDASLLPQTPVERTRNDTCPWRHD